MNEHDASRIARAGLDKTLETGAETVRGVQEGFEFSSREHARSERQTN